MDQEEKIVSDYIDALNNEKKPNEKVMTAQMEDLMGTVRAVHTLREPALPGDDYPEKLAAGVAQKIKTQTGKTRKRWITGMAGMAAVIAVAFLVVFGLPVGGGNVVYAMQKAYEGLLAYHGILTVTETNGLGETAMQAKLEVWADKQGRYYVEELEGAGKGLVTANNGQKKWQIRPDSKEVTIFPAFPDSYRFMLELGREVENAGNALDIKTIGEEMVSGRVCTILQVTPKGGEPYRIWIDKDTSLPLQKQTGARTGSPYQYTATYTSIDFMDAIPAEKMAYSLPAGYSETDKAQQQWVSTLGEAQGLAGFMPKEPQNVPEEYARDGIAVQNSTKTVQMYYQTPDKSKKVVLMQKKADEVFKPDVNAMLGKVGSSTAEILSPVQEWQGIIGGVGPYAGNTGISSIRWQQGGFEYAAVGNIPPRELAEFAKALSGETVEIPGPSQSPQQYQVQAPVDLEAERNDQKSVDEGHSPWKLDPAFVAQVFVSLKISPGGIVGDYPIKEDELKVTLNNGVDAVVEVSGSRTPIARVYLKRLVRQDSTGIWTVVGYDPAAKS